MSVADIGDYDKPNLEILGFKMQRVEDELKDVKESLDKLADSVSKIAVFEEKSVSLARSLDELRADQKTLERRVTQLESSQTKLIAIAQGISLAVKGMWAICGASVVAGIGCLIKLS